MVFSIIGIISGMYILLLVVSIEGLRSVESMIGNGMRGRMIGVVVMVNLKKLNIDNTLSHIPSYRDRMIIWSMFILRGMRGVK